MSAEPDENFQTAIRAFELFTMDEKVYALNEFASLHYPKVEDRWEEAVFRAIKRSECLREVRGGAKP